MRQHREECFAGAGRVVRGGRLDTDDGEGRGKICERLKGGGCGVGVW